MSAAETGGLPPENSHASRPAPGAGDLEVPKKGMKRLLLMLGGIWIGGIVVLFVIFGSGGRNNSYQPQNEFKLDNWVHAGLPLDQQGRALPVPGGDRDLRER